MELQPGVFQKMVQMLPPNVTINALKALLIICVSIPLLQFTQRLIKKVFSLAGTQHIQTLVSKLTYYIGMGGIITLTLHQLGFHVTPFLNTAGIIGALAAFSANTGISNIMSGFFLIAEGPFKIGDVIEFEGKVGVIETMDLLSIKLRTINQTLIRIPNEKVIKGEVINISYFDYQLLKLNIEIPRSPLITDAQLVIHDILSVVNKNEFTVKSIDPVIYLKEFNHETLTFFLGAYTCEKHYIHFRTSLFIELYKAFVHKKFAIPYDKIKITLALGPVEERLVKQTEKE